MSFIQVLVCFFVVMSILGKLNKKSKGKSPSVTTITRNDRPVNAQLRENTLQRSQEADSGRYSQADAAYQRKRQEREKAMQSKNAGNQSTTQLLQEKARKDEIEHRLEKKQQMAEKERIYGRLNYGQRIYLGDPVPNGKRLVYCPYCNAENLVPAHDYSKKYHCYFCREEL